MPTTSRLLALVALTGVAGCTETVAADPPVALQIAVQSGGTPVTLAVNTTVPSSPSVRVTKANGDPFAGARVLFVATGGKGTVVGDDHTTNADGIAQVGTWRYGQKVGAQELTAAIVNSTVDARVVFTGTATAGPTAAITVVPSFVNLPPGGTRQLTVNAVDAFGNTTGSNVAATYQSIDPAVATVSASGLVTAVGFGVTNVTASYLGANASAQVVVGTRPTGTDVVNVPLSARPYTVAVAPQGTAYVVRLDGADFTRFDLPATAGAGTFGLPGPAYDITFRADGAVAFASNTPGVAVSAIDRATNTVLRTYGSVGEPYRVKAAPDGLHFFVTNSTGAIFRINASTDARTSLNLGGALNGLVVNPTRGVLYASNYSGQVFEISLSSFTLQRTVTVGGFPQGMAVSPDGQTLYLANENQGLQILDAATLAISNTVPNTAGAFDVAVTLDGLEVYLSRSAAGEVTVLNAVTRGVIRSITGGQPRRMALTSDGLTLLVANESGWVTIVR